MRIKSIAIILFLPIIILLSCNNDNDCTEEQIAQNQENFNKAYQNWKETLNYMDADVINPSKNLLDSSYQVLTSCTDISTNLMAKIDSISLIFSNYNVKRYQIEIGENKINELEKVIMSIPSKEN